MKISTFSVIVGTKACNASCPFCVSKMTPDCGLGGSVDNLNLRNFDIACRYAHQNGVSTVLFTGKGEPTLYMDHFMQYMEHLDSHKYFPFIELQTNGLAFQDTIHGGTGGISDEELVRLYSLGLTTISLSVVHYNTEINARLLYPNNLYFDYLDLIRKLHSFGFSVRINCTMVRGYIDTISECQKFIEFCRTNSVEQLTFRRVTAPERSINNEVFDWVMEHNTDEHEKDLYRFFESSDECVKLLELPHGATVYDYSGQNVCISNCLTSNVDPEKIRQLIFFPDGHLRYDWKYEGAIIL